MKEKNPELAILDVGCGSGSISTTLAQLVPRGHVVAIDLDPTVLLRAQEVADELNVRNVVFNQGDALKLPFADNSFDISHCHQMLLYLQAPWDALREMLRVTKPGGLVAAREGDMDTECVWPETPELLMFHNLAANLIAAGGGDVRGGRQLLSWALKSGADRSRIVTSYSTWSYSTAEEKRFWAQGMADLIRQGRFRDAALTARLTTEDELERMAIAWQAWKTQEDATLAMVSSEVIIQKSL
ncbi:uncharacterized protein PV09_08898 [Verruconis gallopava]|uniref:Methyltransferase domain-containing protein n=1 Tax=Verruconis gallopava TaxID=253628 RepID=A0A0D2AKG7_9PEZI|nr:uncharacterized protein PV09_08898 [Verruconis gallopava]KIV99478.1 hypothetical protein PV09_08898 [Verruconis gallopava]